MIRKIWALETRNNAFEAALDQVYGRFHTRLVIHNKKTVSVCFPTIPLEVKQRIEGEDMCYDIPDISKSAAVIIYWDKSRMRFFQNDQFI